MPMPPHRGRLPHESASLPAIVLFALAFCHLAPRPARAQQVGWHGRAEASGTLLFGSASDRLAVLRLDGARSDSVLELRADGRFSYGDGEPDGGARVVTARSLGVSGGADLFPFGRVSPFTLASFESSLQARIAGRASGGVGAKYTLRRRDDAEASISLAALVERTRSLGRDTVVASTVAWRNRWSVRVRVRQHVTPTIGISHTTFYQPTMNDPSRFTVNSVTSLDTKLASRLALTLSIEERYDSEARARGARSGNDGQLLLGIRVGG